MSVVFNTHYNAHVNAPSNHLVPLTRHVMLMQILSIVFTDYIAKKHTEPDTTLYFDLKGHFQGHKGQIYFILNFISNF